MRDEKVERKKQARSNKQTRQSNTAHPRQSLFLEKMSMYICPCIYMIYERHYMIVCVLKLSDRQDTVLKTIGKCAILSRRMVPLTRTFDGTLRNTCIIHITLHWAIIFEGIVL